MNKDVLKELAIKATDIVLKANASIGELGFNTAYIQEQWRYEFAKLVEQATLERAAKELDATSACGGYGTWENVRPSSVVRALKDTNE